MESRLQTASSSSASKSSMDACRYLVFAVAITATACAQNGASVSSQGSETHAKELIRAAVQSELAAAERDHSVWTYRDRNKTADKDAVYEVVDTLQGSVRRMIESDGHPVDSETRQRETERIRDFVHDSSAQAKQHKANVHDDAQAREMLTMLPDAFIWTLKSDTGDLVTLSFRPNSDFHAPDMEARVMGTMAGELTIAKADNRIRTLRGTLSDDVKIGFGVLGKLRQGGTFDVERREVAPHHWEITETRVHIDGRALLFKTIGQQEEDVKFDWKPSTAKTLEEAAKQLGAD
jgi:hypothetical protein